MDELMKEPFGLLCRLRSDRNMWLRSFVRELIVPQIAAVYSDGVRDDFEDHDYLSYLVQSLPNLRLVRLMHPLSFNSQYMHSMRLHPNKPELHLLAVQGWEPTPSETLHCVTTIKVTLFRELRHDVPGGVHPYMQAFRDLFFSCPNLKSCSLTMMGPAPPPQQLTRIELTGQEIFPPLQHLALNGHSIHPDEWSNWRTQFPWSSLTSLEIGPQPHYVEDFLGQLSGVTSQLSSLEKFKISVWAGQEEEVAEDRLKRFLLSIDSLQTLEITNYDCTVETVAAHKKLRHLVVRLSENWDSQESYDPLSSSELFHLDRNCPQLETLEIYFERVGDDGNQWNYDALRALAISFQNLRNLTLHVRIGSVRDHGQPLEPKLNYESAREIGAKFFKLRKDASEFRHRQSKEPGAPKDRFEKLTLYTGPGLASSTAFIENKKVEEFNKMTLELTNPHDDIDDLSLVHPERELVEAQYLKDHPDGTAKRVRLAIQVGEDGALHENDVPPVE
ncbi:hypothetical protein N7532_009216 [Penicillium argentinense]|uniref:Uncharacterized protein n=1 Tax=Penicillium argentinense TaxID=1131581 RepID=A0A9W9EYX6_9EURO|nr:uncharacterized protein N7532_009216 [Penicillium argentinense]KAJ5090532.1 hypothetical protein N7532_009216 [Penicillium argentinense]